MMSVWKRIICILLCICMLPIPVLPAAAFAQDVKAVENWTDEKQNQSVRITEDLLISGKVVFTDGAEMLVESGDLTLTPESVFSGNIRVTGDSVRIEIGGKVNGDIIVESPNAMVNVAGKVNGTFFLSNMFTNNGNGQGVLVNILDNAYIKTLYLDGYGSVRSKGQIDVLDTSVSNKADSDVGSGSVRIFYANSQTNHGFSHSEVGTIYENVVYDDHNNFHIFLGEKTHVTSAVIHSGRLNIWNGSVVDEIYADGTSLVHLNTGYYSSAEEREKADPDYLWLPEVGKLTMHGKGTNLFNRGRIGYALLDHTAYFQNDGQIETLVMDSAYLINDHTGELLEGIWGQEPEKVYREVFDMYFDYHVGTLIALNNSMIEATEGSIFKRFIADNSELQNFRGAAGTLVAGGSNTRGVIGAEASVENFAVSGLHSLGIYSQNVFRADPALFPPLENLPVDPIEITAGNYETVAAEISDGQYVMNAVPGSSWLRIPVEVYSTLKLHFDAFGGYGSALIHMPDGTYAFLDNAGAHNDAELFTDTAGEVSIRLMGTSDTKKFTLSAERQLPVYLNASVSEFISDADSDEMSEHEAYLPDYTLSLFNLTQKHDMRTATVTDNAIYCLPGEAEPGDMLEIRVNSNNSEISDAQNTVILDEYRQGSVTLVLKEKGSYRAAPKDDVRARLYIYDRDGEYLREVYPTADGYATGGMSEGIYYALWIRGGIGSWKLLRLSEFSDNNLIEGEHYLLEKLDIRDGEIIVSHPDIPAEPSLQSPWLVAGGTAYESRRSTVVQGDMALFSLEWELSEACEGIENAQITFLAGVEYVEGSASVNSAVIEGVSWQNGVLTVPLSERSGKLLFYAEAKEEMTSMISNAALAVKTPDGLKTQYIGTAQVKVAGLSIIGPSLVSGNEVLFSGNAAPYSELYLLDQGRRVATTIAGARGQWSMKAELSNERVHSIILETEDGLQTAPVTVTRASGAPRLNRFLLDYTEHEIRKQVNIAGSDFGKNEIRYAYEPGTDLVFTLDLENDSLVETVTLVGLQDGNRFELPAENRGNGRWVAFGNYQKEDMFAPDRYTIEYSFREDALAEAFSEPYVSVPLMNTLISAEDMVDYLPLIRYYMASPSMQAVDRGFGPGWFTNYDIFAVMGGTEYVPQLAVWSPTQTRLFVTNNGTYFTEVGGYASARVSSDEIIIEEADGSSMGFTGEGLHVYTRSVNGTTVRMNYDENRRLLSVGTEDISMDFTYDRDGHVTRVSCQDESTAYTYENGALTLAEHADGNYFYSYDGLHTQSGLHPLSSAAQNGETVSFRYNGQGFPALISTNSGQTWLEYGENFMIVRDEEGAWVTYTYSEEGSLTRSETSDGLTTDILPQKDGTVRIVSTGLGMETRLLMDQYGNITEVTDTDGLKISYAYDDRGNLSAVTDKAGNVTRYESDRLGRTTRITYGDNTTEQFFYDSDDNLIRYIDRAGQQTTLEYGEYIQTYTDFPDGQQTVNISRTVIKTLPDGQQITYDYNSDENRTGVTIRQGSNWDGMWTGTDNVRTWDTRNNEISYFNGDSQNFFAYQWADNDQWFGAGSWWYDDDRQFDVAYMDSGEILLHADYEDDMPVLETLPNGVTVHHSWDEGTRTRRMENVGPDGELLSFYETEYDIFGSAVRVENSYGIWLCEYDAIGQLTRIEGPEGITEYTYDAAGNRLSRTFNGETTLYTYDSMNRLLTAGDVRYSYDLNGNLIRKEGDGVSERYEWDVQGQLIRVTVGDQVTEYTYDVFGNRERMTRDGRTLTYYNMPYEISQTLAIADDEGITNFLIGDTGLVAAERDGRRYYYTYTPLGSVSEITDEEGAVLARYAYDLEGQITGTEIPDETMFGNPYTYAGRYGILDDGNGLWCARARFVDQADLRFISPDPAGQLYDLNLYRYAGNDPVSIIDITGESSVSLLDLWKDTWDWITRHGLIQPDVRINKNKGITEILDEKYGTQNDTYEGGNNSKNGTNKGGGNTNFTIWGSGLVSIGGLGLIPVAIPIGDVLILSFLLNPTLAWALIIAGGLMIVLSLPFIDPLIRDLYNWILDYVIRPLIDNIFDLVSSPADTKSDPSGYVYEAVESNRVKGITARVFYRDEEGYAVYWSEAADYDEVNPQTTDELGMYGWDVPTGSWRVEFSKEGYKTFTTAFLPVPPPQTEVNVGIVSELPSEIISAVINDESLEIEFSRYMKPETVKDGLTVNGMQVTFEPLNAEPSAADPEQMLASRFIAYSPIDSGTAVLELTEQAESYAGIKSVPAIYTVEASLHR